MITKTEDEQVPVSMLDEEEKPKPKVEVPTIAAIAA